MSPRDDKGLNVLSDLKQAGENEAGQKLRRAQMQLDAEEERLRELGRHAEHYRHQTSLHTTHLARLQEGRQFLMQLESALQAQREAVESAARRVESARAHWLAARMQRSAIDKLIDQRTAAEELKARQSEQRLADERSARIWSKSRERSGS